MTGRQKGMGRQTGKWRHSLRFRMTASMLLIAILFLALVLQYNFYNISKMRRDSADVLHQKLNIRLVESQKELEKVERFLQSKEEMMPYYARLFKAQSEQESGAALDEIERGYAAALEQYAYIDGFYLCREAGDLFVSVVRENEQGRAGESALGDTQGGIWGAQDGMQEKQWEELERKIQTLLEQYGEGVLEKQAKWFYIVVGDEGYFVRVLENYEMYMGAFFSARTLRDWLKPEEISGAKLLLPDELRGGNIVARARFGAADFDLVVYEKGNLRLEDIGDYINLIVFSAVGLVVCFLFVSFLLRREIVGPLNHLVQVMGRSDEERKHLLREKASCEEFQAVYDAMDEMIDRIQELDRKVYEEQLRRREVSIQYLQLQINPHFLINCMNLIRNLTYMGRADEVEKVTVELGNYMRYVMRNAHWVSLAEELKHVETYIFLQKFRYEEYLEYEFAVDEGVLECKIPIMLLQTFVENSVKHQGDYERVLRIRIEAVREGDELCVKICDNGSGFAPEILKKLQNKEPIYNELGEHVGILNVCYRLELLYEGRAAVEFYNLRDVKHLPAQNAQDAGYMDGIDGNYMGAGIMMRLPLVC